MLFISQLIFTMFIACNNPITGSEKPNIPTPTSTSTEYKSIQGNQVNSVQLENGKSFTIKKGVSASTTSKTGSLLDRYKKLGTSPELVIALWLEACIRAQMGQEEGWNAIGEMSLWTGERLKSLKGWEKHHSTHYFVAAIKKGNPSFRSFIVGAEPENG